MKPVNPKGSAGYRVGLHPTPYEYTEEGIAALAARVPADAELNKAADSVIAEITGANVPEGTDEHEQSDAALDADGPAE